MPPPVRIGHWTNGPAPVPYAYDAEARSLQIDPKKLDIYNFIKQRIRSGSTCSGICWEPNRRGIPSPKGKLWSESVVYGKTSGGLHKKRKNEPMDDSAMMGLALHTILAIFWLRISQEFLDELRIVLQIFVPVVGP